MTPQQVKSIDSIVGVYMEKYKILGLSINIVQHDSELLIKGYGYTDIDKKYPVSENTSFLSCSITKLFTATAVMQLVEQGKLKLDEKLITYLPDFKMRDRRYRDITIRHLLTHSSGLNWYDELKTPAADSIALRSFVYSLADKKLNFAPGCKFSGETYSNTAYNILGYLVEKLSGMPYDAYVRDFILNKAEMQNSTYVHAEVPINRKAMPIVLNGNSREIKRFNLYGEIKDINPILKYPDCKLVHYTMYGGGPEQNPCGNLNTTADDLGKWMKQCLFIHSDSTNGNKLLQHNTLENMWSLQRSIPGKHTSIGLGWWRYNDLKNGDYVFHAGDDPGFSAILILFPNQDLGVAILSNAMYAEDVIWNKIPQAISDVVKFP